MLHGCVLTQHPPFHIAEMVTLHDSISLLGLWGVLPDLCKSSKSCWALVDCALVGVVSHVVAGGALCCTLNF